MLEQKDLVKEHASNIQTFMGIKQIEKKIQDSKGTLHKLSEEGAMNKIEINLEKDSFVEDTLFGMKSLGEVKVKRDKVTKQIDEDKHNTAQMMVEAGFSHQLILK